jgi:hypothetical protein
VHETGKTAEEKGHKDRSLQAGRDSRLYRLLQLLRFPGFFRFMLMALSGYWRSAFIGELEGRLTSLMPAGQFLGNSSGFTKSAEFAQRANSFNRNFLG